MKKTIIKYLISAGYAPSTIRAFLNGSRRPNGDVRYAMSKKRIIPFEAWENIREWLERKAVQ